MIITDDDVEEEDDDVDADNDEKKVDHFDLQEIITDHLADGWRMIFMMMTMMMMRSTWLLLAAAWNCWQLAPDHGDGENYFG